MKEDKVVYKISDILLKRAEIPEVGEKGPGEGGAQKVQSAE